MFSAKIINGRKLYKFARQNIELELKPSIVEIFSMKIINIEMPYITILIDCSKGTYIRALARDIGNYLGVGGYLTDLRRTQIGEHSVENAFRISELLELDKDTNKLTN
ncbi:tRNA pseudouridine synthase B [bioreactor metagenome]|uniref:tRNA pseudouridine(55) synthase n=1 Tax=bioreactor metagenome TaxID=1076179 RepID=A0A645JG27_9ZZZZ